MNPYESPNRIEQKNTKENGNTKDLPLVVMVYMNNAFIILLLFLGIALHAEIRRVERECKGITYPTKKLCTQP